ncbi:MAG: PcfJ domain-containing protein [Bacteroidetes bacterium]|nr:PcfJ domain-containing protein [Bacteroidota bacterium]
MHLFESIIEVSESRKDIHDPVLIYNQFNEIDNSRVYLWVDFFEEHRTGIVGFYQYSMEALGNQFRKNELIRTQTKVEFELSLEFYKHLFNLKKQLTFSCVLSAEKFIVLSLIFGKFSGLFKNNFCTIFNELEGLIKPESVDTLFEKFLIKYETPKFFIKHFHNLKKLETQLFMNYLAGFKPKSFQYDGCLFSPKIQNGIYRFDPEDENIDHLKEWLLVKLWIIFQLHLFTKCIPKTIRITRNSHLFHFRPQQFAKDFSFWRKAVLLMHEMEDDTDYTEIFDFLENVTDNDNPNLIIKDWTPVRLQHEAAIWHNTIYLKQDESLDLVRWDPKETVLQKSFVYKKEKYRALQLLTGKDLRLEGEAMNHCVKTYIRVCSLNQAAIWSIQKKVDNKFVRLMTAEIIENKVVQATAKYNRKLISTEHQILKTWAQEMDYKIGLLSY